VNLTYFRELARGAQRIAGVRSSHGAAGAEAPKSPVTVFRHAPFSLLSTGLLKFKGKYGILKAFQRGGRGAGTDERCGGSYR
jgi:hypothetical protein